LIKELLHRLNAHRPRPLPPRQRPLTCNVSRFNCRGGQQRGPPLQLRLAKTFST
jgi:hypothetical protein